MVLELLKSDRDAVEIARAHDPYPTTVSRWKRTFLENGAAVFSKDATLLTDLHAGIRPNRDVRDPAAAPFLRHLQAAYSWTPTDFLRFDVARTKTSITTKLRTNAFYIQSPSLLNAFLLQTRNPAAHVCAAAGMLGHVVLALGLSLAHRRTSSDPDRILGKLR